MAGCDGHGHMGALGSGFSVGRWTDGGDGNKANTDMGLEYA